MPEAELCGQLDPLYGTTQGRVRRAQAAEAESGGNPVDDSRVIPFLNGAHDVEAFIAATENQVRLRTAILQIG